MKKVDQNWVVDLGSVHSPQLLCSMDYVGPELIIKEEVWEHIPLPLVLVDCSISSMDNTKETILGYLSLFSVCIQQADMKENKPYRWKGNVQTLKLGYVLYCPNE